MRYLLSEEVWSEFEKWLKVSLLVEEIHPGVYRVKPRDFDKLVFVNALDKQSFWASTLTMFYDDGAIFTAIDRDGHSVSRWMSDSEAEYITFQVIAAVLKMAREHYSMMGVFGQWFYEVERLLP
jgi:hypothetical protein